MIKSIKTITDRSMFHNILGKFFFNKTSFIHTQKGNIEVKFLDSPNGIIKLLIPNVLEEPQNCMAFTRHGTNVIFVYLKLLGKEAKDVFLFNPAKFQVIMVEREDGRKSLIENAKDKSIIYITNFISDIIINNSLTSQENKLKRIKEAIDYDRYNEYEYLRIYFYNEGLDDARMKYFYNNRMPIIIPDINSQSSRNDNSYLYYKKFIYNHDAYLKDHKELISEISVPILFDSKIPYGYIQANKSTPFSKSALSIVKRLASLTSELSIKNKLFTVSSDKLLVSDVSQKGMGIVFKNRKYIPYYKKDSYVSLDMMLPMAKKASILADVRHLEMMQNKVIKVGFEIKDMDNASKDNYERFLGSISA